MMNSKQLFHTKSFIKLAIQNIESLHNNRIINFFDSFRRENLGTTILRIYIEF